MQKSKRGTKTEWLSFRLSPQECLVLEREARKQRVSRAAVIRQGIALLAQQSGNEAQNHAQR